MDSEIVQFYDNLNVLITGGTGLLGQLLVEKLLRVCSGVAGIYLILRAKRGKTASERIEESFKDALFDKLREANPEFAKKIHVLNGDCSQINLGLDQFSREIIISKVNIVFHCAATLNMEAKLKDAVNTNVRGLQELLVLCREMVNLKSMVFVSTAYSNCIYERIEEKFYQAPLKPDTIIKLIQETDDAVLDNIANKLMDKWPNTYCYSKAIAEDSICQNVNAFPVALFRPSIIMPTYSEPTAGWTSNLYGPIGFFLASGLGVSRVTLCDPNGKLDFVPADFCVNALICTAWETHEQFHSSAASSPVYNFSAGEQRNITIQKMADYTMAYEYPLKNALWATSQTITNCRPYYIILQMLLHYIPGYLIDFTLLLRGKKTRMIKAYGKLSKMTNVLTFFTCQEWNIINDNVENLWNRLSQTDKTLFPFDLNVVDYKYFLFQCALGIKLYILKETLDNVDEEKRKYRRLVKLHKGLKFTLQMAFLVLMLKLITIFF